MCNVGNSRYVRCLVNHNDELITAETSSDTTRWHHCANTSTNDLEKLIPGSMAKRIVDALKAIDIHEKNRDLV